MADLFASAQKKPLKKVNSTKKKVGPSSTGISSNAIKAGLEGLKTRVTVTNTKQKPPKKNLTSVLSQRFKQMGIKHKEEEENTTSEFYKLQEEEEEEERIAKEKKDVPKAKKQAPPTALKPKKASAPKPNSSEDLDEKFKKEIANKLAKNTKAKLADRRHHLNNDNDNEKENTTIW